MWNVETVCINENFSDFCVCIPSKITHTVVVVVKQNMCGYLGGLKSGIPRGSKEFGGG